MKTMYGTTREDRIVIRKINEIMRQAERIQEMCADIRDKVGDLGDERWMHNGWCQHCNAYFDAFRSDAKFCSPKCQRAARKKAVEKVGVEK